MALFAIRIWVVSFGHGKPVNFTRPTPQSIRRPCGKDSYFARVALVRDWIDEQLGGATFCRNNGDADDQ